METSTLLGKNYGFVLHEPGYGLEITLHKHDTQEQKKFFIAAPNTTERAREFMASLTESQAEQVFGKKKQQKKVKDD